MKRFLISLSIMTMAVAGAWAQAKVQTATYTISDILLYRSGAMLTSKVSATLQPGLTELTVKGVTQKINVNSITVSGSGSAVIMGVKYNKDFIIPGTKTPEIIQAEDSLKLIARLLDSLNIMKNVYTSEEEMILANKQMKGTEENIKALEVEEMSDFYRERLTEIRLITMRINYKINDLNGRRNKLNGQLTQLTGQPKEIHGEIKITLQAKAVTAVNLTVSYLVTEAGWHPIYDIRSPGTGKDVQLTYKANVYQSTGVNWDRVNLKLSTGNPTVGGIKPELFAWYISTYNPNNYYGDADTRYRSYGAPVSKSYDSEQVNEVMDNVSTTSVSDYTTVSETSLAVEFAIALPYDVPTGGNPVLVDVQNYALPTLYKHYTTPKLDQSAFLMALITGWGQYNLLPGMANVYMEGSYVGETFLNPSVTNDTLLVSLGRDSRVVVTRAAVKDYTTRRVIGTNIKSEYGYEITIRNTKKEAVEIVIDDQIPVSSNSQIEVELIDQGGAEYDAATGRLIWKLSIPAESTQKVTFRFSVKYPKNITVYGL